jgi:hypothetical protein
MPRSWRRRGRDAGPEGIPPGPHRAFVCSTFECAERQCW